MSSKRTRMSQNKANEMETLSSTSFSRKSSLGTEDSNKANVVSHEISSLYQLSFWVSKKTYKKYISVLLWLSSETGGNAHAERYGSRVGDGEKCLEVFVIWLSAVVTPDVLVERARLTGRYVEDSEVLVLRAAVTSAWASSF